MNLQDLAADILEAPELSANLVGQALSAIGNELQALADRIAALEAQLRGDG